MKKIILSAILSFISFPIFSQWLPTNGPEGGSVKCFCYSSSAVFAGTSYGVYASTNGGARWELSSKGLPSSNIFCLASKGDTVLAGITEGLYYTTNNGNNWIVNYYDGGAVTSVLIKNNRIYVWYFGKFAFTDDFGQNWTVRDCPSEYAKCSCILDSALFVGDFYSYAYKSTDMGLTWDSVRLGANYLNAADLKVYNNYVYLCSTSLYRSSNNGITWTPLSGLYNPKNLCYDESLLYAATDNGLYVSTNMGSSWTSRPINGSVYAVTALMYNSNKVFAGVENSDIYFTANHGANWTQSISGYTNLYINSLSVIDSVIYASTTQKGVFKSSDNGNNWTKLNTPSITNVNFVKSLNNKLYMGYSNGLYSSTNSGSNWSALMTNVNVRDMIAKDTFLFVSTSSGVYRSSFNGSGFNITGLTNGNVNRFAVKGNLLLAASLQGIFYSANNGNGWGQSSSQWIYDMVVLNNDIYAGGISKVYKSTDGGYSWYPTNTSGIFVNGLYVVGNTLYALTRTGVLSTSDGGQNWTDHNEGLVFPDTKCLVAKGNYAYLGTGGNSVYKRPLSEIIGISSTGNEIPVNFNLYQNYPNPFNPVTKIKFDVAQLPGKNGSGNTFVGVYDMLGRSVKTLVNEQLNPGSYEVTFDGSGLPSGIYYCRLLSGSEFKKSVKMVLLK